VGFPKFAIVDILDFFPGSRRAGLVLPSDAEMAVVKTTHLRRKPGWDVNAIRDVTDGHRVFQLAGK
jgi:hypothetical protein